jgi:hypothetical protein
MTFISKWIMFTGIIVLALVNVLYGHTFFEHVCRHNSAHIIIVVVIDNEHAFKFIPLVEYLIYFLLMFMRFFVSQLL